MKKCDEYVTKTIKGRSVRRRCRRYAMDGSTKCFKHGGADAYEGDVRLAPGNYGRIGRILAPPSAEANEVYAARMHVMRVLKGEMRPGWEFAQKLAAAAGVTLEELAKHLATADVEKELREISKRRKAAA